MKTIVGLINIKIIVSPILFLNNNELLNFSENKMRDCNSRFKINAKIKINNDFKFEFVINSIMYIESKSSKIEDKNDLHFKPSLSKKSIFMISYFKNAKIKTIEMGIPKNIKISPL
ncbi:hypothetical protein ND861_19400 [Leptospira sp. 2 VSF19]|uniref:Uncharacterized protein n=1 Tax=Leptospira soteropolitanensis TaxID=2950025 RepID=A0AAW5VTU2_9LEPT|nr:hypothetical protein [Leptospira soteropolitanensis]MCW7494841.1 hypothetical protein [Leptospira soteropolitanensis]MCW7502420.1 hypothetical protein [Leptospira soteropolitanensis]MCW7528531.1 hypothetical protein [Leptospira soteropolitanensis]MCW7532390.1 hypothetical protein [Leptospira soteropolitanensis]